MIGSRMSDLPPTDRELAVERGEVGRDWELAMQAQADLANEDRENEGEGDDC